eukprot:6197162-Pleurochrysis_carterae.AAC.3
MGVHMPEAVPKYRKTCRFSQDLGRMGVHKPEAVPKYRKTCRFSQDLGRMGGHGSGALVQKDTPIFSGSWQNGRGQKRCLSTERHADFL